MSKGNRIALEAVDGALTILQLIEIGTRFHNLAKQAIAKGDSVATPEEIAASFAYNDEVDVVVKAAMDKAIAEGR